MVPDQSIKVKFIYSEKAKKFWKIFALLLTEYVIVKSIVKILQNFEAFSEYMNFTSDLGNEKLPQHWHFPCQYRFDVAATKIQQRNH